MRALKFAIVTAASACAVSLSRSAHSISAAAEIRTDPCGSRTEGSFATGDEGADTGDRQPQPWAASGRVSAARPSIRITGPTVPATVREVQRLCTSICTSSQPVGIGNRRLFCALPLSVEPSADVVVAWGSVVGARVDRGRGAGTGPVVLGRGW